MRAEKLLTELIALPSVNPAFLPVGDPMGGEARVAEYLESIACKLGLDVGRGPVVPGRWNVLAKWTPPGAVKHSVVLAPHMDTVGGPAHLFEPTRRNGRIYGRGACDTKGSLAVMLAALARILESGPRPQHTEITLAALVDEENGQSGSRALVAARFRADLAIVGEPTELKVVTAHKGDLWLKLKTKGKAAHGACPELGRNAVHAMAKVVDLLETEYAAILAKRKHPLLGRPTINVGSIAGGTQPNIVPDRCTIFADRRTIPGETERGVVREIRALLRQHGLRATLADKKLAPCIPMETNIRQPLVRSFMAAAGQTKPVGVHFFCDASVLSRGGIPSVVFGPGSIAQAHTLEEWVSLRQLKHAEQVLVRFLSSLP